MSRVDLFLSALLVNTQPLLAFFGLSSSVVAVQLAVIFAITLIKFEFEQDKQNVEKHLPEYELARKNALADVKKVKQELNVKRAKRLAEPHNEQPPAIVAGIAEQPPGDGEEPAVPVAPGKGLSSLGKQKP